MTETGTAEFNMSEWEKRYHLAHQELLTNTVLLEHQKKITEALSLHHATQMATAIALNTQLQVRVKVLEGVGPDETLN